MKLGTLAFTTMFSMLLFISWIAYETTHKMNDALIANEALQAKVKEINNARISLVLDRDTGDAILVVNGVTREYIPKLCPAQHRL